MEGRGKQRELWKVQKELKRMSIRKEKKESKLRRDI